jgi:hypothetical protein
MAMKKKILILIAIGISNIVQAQTSKLSIEASFNGTRCNGAHGLCVVEPALNKTDSNAQLYYNEKGRLVMEIPWSKLEEGEINTILGEMYKATKPNYAFVMEDTFILSDELLHLLKLPKGIGEIPKGTYQALVYDDCIIIEFELR